MRRSLVLTGAVVLVLGAAPAAGATSGTMTITTDTVLTEDHDGVIVIAADGVTLDCAGFTVTGFPDLWYTILVPGRDDVTVRNCNVTNGLNGIAVIGFAERTTVTGNSTFENGNAGIAADDRGRSFVYRELYRPNLIVSDAAEQIKAHSAGEEIFEYLAPPDLWNRQRETGRTIADIFASRGVVLTRTGNARIDGWMAVKEELKIQKGEDGRDTAALRIFSDCKNLIRCMSLLRHDENRPNDVAHEPHEITHAPDALRANPTPEHLAPIFVALGARADGDRPDTIHEEIVLGSFSMRSFALRPGGPAAAPTRSP
jgi:hypothetical protein